MSFHETSQSIWLEDNHILHCECQDVDGNYVAARLDLDYYIGNSNGYFSWGGENFSHSAESVSFEIEGDSGVPVLRATLGDGEGGTIDANLNLSERIGNDNGTLIFRE